MVSEELSRQRKGAAAGAPVGPAGMEMSSSFPGTSRWARVPELELRVQESPAALWRRLLAEPASEPVPVPFVTDGLPCFLLCASCYGPLSLAEVGTFVSFGWPW